jgi:ferredoxin
MTSVRIEISKKKCQAFGNCIARAPTVFALAEDKKVALVDTAGAADDTILQAAKSCPYRAIAVSNEHGEQIFPPARK